MTVGSKTATYAYDADGIRTQKTVDGVTHTYYTLNGKLMRESFPYSDTTIIMDFIYDESGKPFAVCYSKDGGANFTTYFYATNLQGDVEGIFRVLKNGTTGLYEQKWYGRYTYDAWGNVTAHTAAGANPSTASLIYRNPLRYRGYVYDNETGFYYLQSRYYDPANHRFINADSYASTGQGFLGYNMFAYCNNNPISFLDAGGNKMVSRLGLDLPPGEGVEIIIDGETFYYYSETNTTGELYEYWYDSNGNLKWVRHHSNHGNPKKHNNPHDHTGTKDNNGENKPGPPTDVNPKFTAPKRDNQSGHNNKDSVAGALGFASAGFCVYVAVKWIVAALLAAPTGGGSLAVAGATP